LAGGFGGGGTDQTGTDTNETNDDAGKTISDSGGARDGRGGMTGGGAGAGFSGMFIVDYLKAGSSGQPMVL
jgi:hypothetical protein